VPFLNVQLGLLNAALPDAPGLARAFDRIVRDESPKLLNYLTTLETDFTIGQTKARSHCYALALDGMDQPATGLLVDTVCSFIVEYAIPRSRIANAIQELKASANSSPIVTLHNEARELFTHLKQSGEGGELLLYCFAEMVLGYPQVLAKMYLKTAGDVHYHGADGVHASADPETGKLTLWWGESKLHKSVTGATTQCLKSLAPFLIESQSDQDKRSRDLQLLRQFVDLNDPKLEAAIKAYLDRSSGLYKQVQFGGLGLVGFDHDCYPPHPKKADADAIAAAIAATSDGWKKHLEKRIAKHQLDEIDIHLFFLPFPSVDDFRTRVLKTVGV
jgi:hypothetical protein